VVKSVLAYKSGIWREECARDFTAWNSSLVDPNNLRLALLSAAVLGFRHGLDYDHIAAITDISSVQLKVRDAMRYGLLYVAGHATTIALLGAAAVVFRIALPAASDRWAERLVGLTLLVLGLYVLGTFFRPSVSGSSTHDSSSHGSAGDGASSRGRSAHSHAHPRTRITLLANGALWIYWRLSRIFGGTRVEAPQVFKDGYGSRSTFLVGVIHGLGAETPTQILLFLMAANLGGTAAGLLGLLMFIVGLLTMNTLMCALAAGLFSADKVLAWLSPAGAQNPFSRALGSVLGAISAHAMGGLTLLTSVYSIVVGAIFLLGSASKLPSLTG
jgi:high-affinity nickel-transport protein